MGEYLLRQLTPAAANAEIIPRDPEAVALLNSAYPVYQSTIDAAHRDPRPVSVYAGPRAQFLKESNAGGFFQPSVGYIGMGRATVEPNTVMVGPPHLKTDPRVARWLGEKRGLPLPNETVLAHELGHFLLARKDEHGEPLYRPLDEEFAADVLAANPDGPWLREVAPATKSQAYYQQMLDTLLGPGRREGFSGVMGPKAQPDIPFEMRLDAIDQLRKDMREAVDRVAEKYADKPAKKKAPGKARKK